MDEQEILEQKILKTLKNNFPFVDDSFIVSAYNQLRQLFNSELGRILLELNNRKNDNDNN